MEVEVVDGRLGHEMGMRGTGGQRWGAGIEMQGGEGEKGKLMGEVVVVDILGVECGMLEVSGC